MWKNWSGKTTNESTNHEFPSTPSIDDGMFCFTLSICFVSRTLQLITAVSTDCVFLTFFLFFWFHIFLLFLPCYSWWVILSLLHTRHKVVHAGIVRWKDNWGHRSSKWSKPSVFQTLSADCRSQPVHFRLISETSLTTVCSQCVNMPVRSMFTSECVQTKHLKAILLKKVRPNTWWSQGTFPAWLDSYTQMIVYSIFQFSILLFENLERERNWTSLSTL